LGPDKTYLVIVSDELSPEENEALLILLKKHRKVIGYSINDLKGISPTFCTHRIPMENQCKPVVDHQRKLTHSMREIVKKEVIKLLDAGIIYPVPHSEWVSLVHCVPKKGGLIVVKNEKNELIPQRTVTGWRMCIDYRKLNKATKKDHFPPTVHRRHAREVSKPCLFLLSRWVLGVHANSHSPGRSTQDNVYL
jgi:hypothetical protein